MVEFFKLFTFKLSIHSQNTNPTSKAKHVSMDIMLFTQHKHPTLLTSYTYMHISLWCQKLKKMLDVSTNKLELIIEWGLTCEN